MLATSWRWLRARPKPAGDALDVHHRMVRDRKELQRAVDQTRPDVERNTGAEPSRKRRIQHRRHVVETGRKRMFRRQAVVDRQHAPAGADGQPVADRMWLSRSPIVQPPPCR